MPLVHAMDLKDVVNNCYHQPCKFLHCNGIKYIIHVHLECHCSSMIAKAYTATGKRGGVRGRQGWKGQFVSTELP